MTTPRVTVRVHTIHAWRVWREGRVLATIEHREDRYVLVSRKGRPIAKSRDWHTVKQFAKKHYATPLDTYPYT